MSNSKVIKKSYNNLTQEKSDRYISQKAISILKEYERAEEKMEELETKVDAVKKSLYASMEANDVKSFETDDFKFTLIPPTDTLVMNTQKLKDEGVYEYYRDKKSHRNGYVKFTRKKKVEEIPA